MLFGTKEDFLVDNSEFDLGDPKCLSIINRKTFVPHPSLSVYPYTQSKKEIDAQQIKCGIETKVGEGGGVLVSEPGLETRQAHCQCRNGNDDTRCLSS